MMALEKPYKRTVRILTDGTYSNGGHWQYLLHPQFANDPQHYIRAFLLIQDDLLKLFEFVEPCDQNLNTVSLKIQKLLTRVCIEIEANFTAILSENKYSSKSNWTLKNDYCLIEVSHKLSSYMVKLPIWKGSSSCFMPFKNWATRPNKDWHVLDWYQAYNKSKHDRHNHFDKATLLNLLNAVSALAIVLSAQFMDESYSPRQKGLGIGGSYSYDYDPLMDTAVGDYFRVKYPKDWVEEEQYGFNWTSLRSEANPIDTIDYDIIKQSHSL